MPKFTKAYSFGLVTDLPYIVMEPTIRLLNDQRVQRGRAAQGAFTWSDFFPQFFFSTFQNWQSGSATRLAKRPGLAMFYFGIRRSRESDHRLEAKIDRPPPIRGIDQAQFGYQEEEEVQGCGLTAKPTLNA
jgi:hypothetical protein